MRAPSIPDLQTDINRRTYRARISKLMSPDPEPAKRSGNTASLRERSVTHVALAIFMIGAVVIILYNDAVINMILLGYIMKD